MRSSLCARSGSHGMIWPFPGEEARGQTRLGRPVPFLWPGCKNPENSHGKCLVTGCAGLERAGGLSAQESHRFLFIAW